VVEGGCSVLLVHIDELLAVLVLVITDVTFRGGLKVDLRRESVAGM
jgi:hypothetical protein